MKNLVFTEALAKMGSSRYKIWLQNNLVKTQAEGKWKPKVKFTSKLCGFGLSH